MNQQMVMIGHQAVSGYLKIPALRRFLKNLDKGIIIMTRQEDFLSSPATIHDMIPSSWIFYAQWSGHD
jgi:hypothetical protein